MNQPMASKSALSDESHWDFGPVIRVKGGVAVRRRQLGASPALLSDFPELGSWEELTRAASRKARPFRIDLLSSRIQQQDLTP
jgi:hypothetical protein